MNSLGKKVGYLKGLLEGLTFSDPAQEKLMRAMVDLLNELCDQVESMDDLLDDLNDYVETIDDDLSALEDEHDTNFQPFDDDFEEDDYLDDLRSPDRLHLIGGKDGDAGEADGDEANAEEDDAEANAVADAIVSAYADMVSVDEDDGDEEDEEEDIDGVVCPDCLQPFFIDLDDPEGSVYVCPHCGHKVVPTALTLENAPIARPVEDGDD